MTDGSVEHPLGAAAAGSCPVRTQWDVLRPSTPEPSPAFVAHLAEAADRFRARMYDRLVGLLPATVRIDAGLPWQQRARATLAAMGDGAPLVTGGHLPTDVLGGRNAAPRLLIRVGGQPVEGRWRYRPADVHRHGMLVDPDTGVEVVAQDLQTVTDPSSAPAEPVGRRDGTAKRDLLRLAHDWRTLEACGHGATGSPWVGVVGGEERLVWYRLDQPIWHHTNRRGDRRTDASTLVVYDLEFAWRRDIAAAAIRHRQDPTEPLPLKPVQIHECPGCPWREHCGAFLEERRDVSLLPTVSERVWTALEAVALDTIPALARVDEADAVDSVADIGADHLGAAIDEARAWIGDDPVYLRRHLHRLDLPRADVEVDVDMENVPGGTYLWGTLVTDRSGRGVVTDGYRAFVDWDRDASAAGASAFARFWTWLRQLRSACDAAGVSFAAYCWFASAENQWLRVGGDHLDVADEVEGFVDSPAWIDLYAVVRRQLVTGHAYGLKVVAGLLGFRWRDEDPGGAQSMQWWEQAVDPSRTADERGAARRRLLAYNEDDVAATRHVRDWLEQHAGQLRSVTDADG